ncbi:probable disease resistance protein At4g27220 [Rutidosis leptorrhynchoides]|uniref:probable disease resistance protein At4g27220 n=1 Tax=Rutidosis leptorrhynchoides TaxID=125765 RepID=UPI003A99F6ED
MAEGVIVTSVAEKAVDTLFVVVKKKIGYMWNCKQNVENYKSEVQKLKDMKGRIQQKIDSAKSKGDDLVHGVEGWVNDVNAEISKAEDFITEEANAKKTCFGIGLCGNWSTLHHYGKKATETASLMKLQELGKPYESCVSVDTRPPGLLDVYQHKNLEGIVTQKSALKEILSAIKDESKQIIGIYGVGGVGKTTLANEVAARVKNLFADVVFTTISQSVNVHKIQKDTEDARKRVMQGENILIILDDLWKEVNLDELGIPWGIRHKNCKILMTSRREDVCDRMKAQTKICVNSLTPEEAWIFFKRVVGDKVENDNMKPVAEEIVKECGGLPLMINAIGNTLKNRNINSWKAALTQLQKNVHADIDPSIRKEFTRLKLSYDYLESEEAQWCFLQCSMFPEDSDIWLEDLVNYRVGLEKFKEFECMEEARSKVQNAVNILKSSSLLLDSDQGKHYAKMHDVVRDVALLIASGSHKPFSGDTNDFPVMGGKGLAISQSYTGISCLIATEIKTNYLVKARKGLTEWLPRNNISQSYTGISLMHNKIRNIPDYHINFPQLEAAYLQHNCLQSISDEFTEGIKKVRVLDLAFNEILLLPKSLMGLSQLRMLNLSGNKSVCEISILGELKGLEILILNGTGIKEVPECIGQLVNLRKLEVRDCEELLYITPGVILNLYRLEELCIEFMVHSKEIHACLVEVMCLSKLTCLRLEVPHVHDIPEGFNFDKLNGFDVQIGKHGIFEFPDWTSKHHLTLNMFKLEIPLLKWMKKLIQVSRPDVTLVQIQNLNNIMPDLYYDGFNKLENIEVLYCNNVTCLVDTYDWEGNTNEKLLKELKNLRLVWLYNFEVLWKCPDQFISLTNLIHLHIEYCHKLVRLFPLSVAKGLVSLKEIYIISCGSLEEVIWGETEMATNIIVFPCLSTINLEDLKKLKSFYSRGSCNIKYPFLGKVTVKVCLNMEMWGPGTHETPQLRFVDDVPLNEPYSINDAVVESVKQWEQQRAEALTYKAAEMFMSTIFDATV